MDNIEKKAFVNYTLPEDKDESVRVVSLKLNEEEQALLKEDKRLLLQAKDGTAIKQLMRIGSKVLRDEKIAVINDIILNNYRKNKRMGIINIEEKVIDFSQK